MIADVEEWVVYHLPKSVSHGQASRIRDPRKAWPAVQKFLTALTQVTLDPRVLLMCLEIEPLEVAAARIDEARRRFGPETAQSPTLVWTLSETQLASAIDFALDDDKFPRQAFGPSLVTFSYRFFWNAFVSDPVEENRAERDPASSDEQQLGQYHYPSIIQAADGTLHATYSFFAAPAAAKRDGENRLVRKAIKHAHFNESWIRIGDDPAASKR